MFLECSSLSDIKSLEKWNVSNGINFSYMLGGCSSLSNLKTLEKWNVSNRNIFMGTNKIYPDKQKEIKERKLIQ